LAQANKLEDSTFFRPDPDERGLWLSSAGKGTVIDAMLSFMKTSTEYEGRKLRRSVQIDMEAQKLAVILKGV
jgi:hypothetical protein